MKLPAHYDNFRPKIAIPDGFYLIQDTREQKPLWKSKPWIVNKGLKSGDYSIQGFEDSVSIERKSISDLYGSLGGGRKRFERELNRLLTYRWKGVIIEGLEAKVYHGGTFSAMHPNSVYHSLAAMETKWGLHLYYAPNRYWARYWVLSRMTKLFKYLRDDRMGEEEVTV